MTPEMRRAEGRGEAVSADTALLREQAKRRHAATCVAHVYRSRSTGGPEPIDAADEEEIEVAVDGGYYPAEPDVGIMSGGYDVEKWAIRIDNGEPIELTPDEVERIAIDETENADDGYDGPDTLEEARGER